MDGKVGTMERGHGQNLDGLEVQAGVDGHHHTHFHALRNDAGRHLVHKTGQFAHGNKVRGLENLLLFAGTIVVVFLAINFLDRLLGKVGHHARDVLAYHFLLLFLLLLRLLYLRIGKRGG